MDIISELCNIDKNCISLKKSVKEYSFNGIITCNNTMIEQIELLNRIINKDANILINGETGTGKEVYAEYIHKNSNRKNNRFVKLNCSTIPDQLFESEMFGYATGAFTGASKFGKKGLFELADYGTIFLDEIGEMPLETQSKLLRVIQEKSFRKVGSESEVNVDVKIISATNKNLNLMIQEKKFREDLYYRLNVFPITLIPLRERKEDIVLLTLYFLDECNNKYGYSKKINYDVVFNFLNYNWPGNVRELRNSVERLVLLTTDDIIHNSEPVIGQYNFEKNFNNSCHIEKDTFLLKEVLDEGQSLKQIIDDYETEVIKLYIKKTGSLRNAAKALKSSPATLSRKLSHHKT
jgi:transcriptional regulator with PAS, ATPase and Fis domain